MDFIITGGAGYLGSHLAKKLKGKHRVIIIDDLSGSGNAVTGTEFFKLDLRNAASLKKVNFGAERPAIYHLAANPIVQDSMINAKEHFSRSVTATRNAMELAGRLRASAFVFSSTSAVYGEARTLPTPENYRPRPVSNYGKFKLMAEGIVQSYSKKFKIPSVTLRFANITGGLSKHGVVYDFISKLNSNASSLEILGDGGQKKSYLYIEDALAALRLASDPSMGYDVYNAGSADSITVDGIADIVCREMGLHPQYSYSDKFEGRGWLGDIRLMQLDIRKIKRRTGWSPKYNSATAIKLAVRDMISKGTDDRHGRPRRPY